MKSRIASNWRPLLRACYPFLIAIAALWAMTRTAHAQLYVTQRGNGMVSKYNATTGAKIKVDFITGLPDPRTLAVLDNSLFVGTAKRVGKYNATTGAVIDARFLAGMPTLLGLVVDNLETYLFVSDLSFDTVNKFDVTTRNGGPFITPRGEPFGLALRAPTRSVPQTFLFVAIDTGAVGWVGKYDATTGATINASFITGLISPFGLAVKGNTLFVADFKGNTVGKYDATTGETINASFVTGLDGPSGLVVFGNILFVANGLASTVGEYDATTGATINANFITGLSSPCAIAVK